MCRQQHSTHGTILSIFCVRASISVFLSNKNEKVRLILFVWSEAECMVEDLRRAPEMLELYKNTGPLIKSKYGSTANFIKWKLDFERDSESISQNASWPAALAHDAPPSQYRITLNDFPYGIPQDGQHFVVWGRVPLLIREAASSAAEWEDVEHRGIAGFTGFPELQDRGFGVQDGQCGEQMRRFVERHWPADEGWQTMLCVFQGPIHLGESNVHFVLFFFLAALSIRFGSRQCPSCRICMSLRDKSDPQHSVLFAFL